ncbi:MAG: NnrS family protein [Oricola sp.]
MEADSQHSLATDPVILKQGFRPFFLGAAAWAVVAMALYVAALTDFGVFDPAYSLIDWHVHEFLFGYSSAVIAGFLLTAVPNWTSRPPIAGLRLGLLFGFWLAGRIAVGWSGAFGIAPAAIIDLAFPVLLVVLVGRELIAARNHRNLGVLALVVVFGLANAGFHYEVAVNGAADYSERAGIAVVLTLIMLIGGRIIPAFTRNWMTQHDETDLPYAFDRFDGLTVLVSVLAFGLWTALPAEPLTAFALGLAGCMNFVRLGRWHGYRTFSEGLVAVLHIAYGFIPAGMLAMAVSTLDPLLVPLGAAVHLLTVGAIGTMTVAVMTRASLGHTGHRLHADRAILTIYLALVLSALFRVAYALEPGYALLIASASLWMAAFAILVLRFRYIAVR